LSDDRRTVRFRGGGCVLDEESLSLLGDGVKCNFIRSNFVLDILTGGVTGCFTTDVVLAILTSEDWGNRICSSSSLTTLSLHRLPNGILSLSY
jgi:hypothetical protein